MVTASQEFLHDKDFIHWLQTKYKPIAGGWQY